MNPEPTPNSPIPMVVGSESAPPTNGDPQSPPASRLAGLGSSRLPRRAKWSSRRKLLTIAGLAALAVMIFVGLLWATGAIFHPSKFDGATFEVRSEVLKVNVVARGSLESANYGDITCKVRAGTKGGTIATTIKEVVDAGVMVNEGDQVMVLDYSGLEE